MKKTKNTLDHTARPKVKKVIVKNIAGHKPTRAYVAALRAVAAMGKK